MGNSFFHSLSRKAASDPDGVCFHLYGAAGREKILSFRYMHRRVSETAQMFLDLGLCSGDVVLIFAQHSEGMLLAFLGAQWIGAVPSFMPPPTRKQDRTVWAANHKELLNRIQPKIVVSEPAAFDHVLKLSSDLISTDEIEQYESDRLPPLADTKLDAIAFLQHSSGTTGLKKGVVVTYRQLIFQLSTYGSAIGLD
jgi:fatty-acyl-CoA synthase